MDGSVAFTAAQTGLEATGSEATESATSGSRPQSFLFLQGPISTFYDRLGRALIARGHKVHRVNLHGGDRLFWHLPATDYRGRLEDFRGFVADLMDRERVTQLVVHGDRRPYHLIAADEARARGIPVIATDLGYLRPDWITLEYDGLSSYSRFPRDPAAIRELARQFPEPDINQRFHSPFWLIAGLDIAYNIGLVFGRPLYPHYHYHSTCHPFAEYAGWLGSRAKLRLKAGAAKAAKERLQNAPGSYFLVPLQLCTDYQIRAHSPYDDIREAVREIVASYAAGATTRELVFVAHPLDNGIIDWDRVIADLAAEHGVAERVLSLSGGTPAAVLCNAAGVITVNSTIGIAALHNRVPVKVLGNAVFDVPGLTHQGSLDEFWHAPAGPDPALMRDFARALAGTTQVKGGYYRRDSQEYAIAGFVERLERGLFPLPPVSHETFAARPPRQYTRAIVIAGRQTRATSTLARSFAAPGVRLAVLGNLPPEVAADCRRRGALVTLVDRAELDALDAKTPIDTLVGPIDRAGDLPVLMADITAAAQCMRSRGSGRVVLVSGIAGHRPQDPAREVSLHRLVARYAPALRTRLSEHGISVTMACPGFPALHLARWLEAPQIAVIGPDRAAAAALAAAKRGKERTAFISASTLIWRALRALPGKLRDGARKMLLEVDEAAPEATDRIPLAGKSSGE